MLQDKSDENGDGDNDWQECWKEGITLEKNNDDKKNYDDNYDNESNDNYDDNVYGNDDEYDADEDGEGGCES